MSLSTARTLLDAAVRERNAVLALNVITLEFAEAIVAGAEQAESAVIFQVSENAISFHGGRMMPLLLACRELAEGASVPVALHLDHVQDEALAREAISCSADTGLSSIMIDAAHLPYRENLSRTRELTALAHSAGLWVEAELGSIGGKDGAHAPGVRTDPDEAESFVLETGVDALAVAVGSSHAMISRDAVLDIDLIGRLAARVPVPLVLHGSSGVSDVGLTDAVAAGMRKVNVGTALTVAFTTQIRQFLDANTTTSDPRRYLVPARNAISAEVRRLCEVLDG